MTLNRQNGVGTAVGVLTQADPHGGKRRRRGRRCAQDHASMVPDRGHVGVVGYARAKHKVAVESRADARLVRASCVRKVNPPAKVMRGLATGVTLQMKKRVALVRKLTVGELLGQRDCIVAPKGKATWHRTECSALGGIIPYRVGHRLLHTAGEPCLPPRGRLAMSHLRQWG